jgi:phosphonate transport system permease protein
MNPEVPLLPQTVRSTRRSAAALLLVCASCLALLPWDLDAIASQEARVRSWARLAEFLRSFGAPDVANETLTTALGLVLETASTALLGVALGLCLGVPLAIGAARCVALDDAAGRSGTHILQHAMLQTCRLALDILRGVPDLAWALILVNFTGMGPITGVLALGLSIAGILGKVLSEQWDNVDPQRYAALRATGASRLAVFAYGIVPWSARSSLSFVLMRTECAIRNASVLGVVGGGGLGSGLWDAFKDSDYGRVVTMLIAMLALTASADLAANVLRHQLRTDPNHPRATRKLDVRATTQRRILGALLCAALLLASAWALRTPFAVMWTDLGRLDLDFSLGYAARLLFLPDPTAVPSAIVQSFIPLAVGLLSTVAATVFAAALALPASFAFQIEAHRFTGEQRSLLRTMARGSILLAARAAALLWRGVPEIAWLLILAAFFRQGLLAGVLAVTVHSTGVLLRVFAETIDNVPYRQLELVPGGRRAITFAYAAVPVAWNDWKTYAFFQFEVNLRMGIVLGMVGVGGLGAMFDSNLKFYELNRASTYLWTMVLLTVALDRISRRLQLHRRRC